MFATLLLVTARRERGRRLMCALAERRVAVASIEEALSREINEATAAGRPQLPPRIEPRVVVALVRLLEVAEANVDDLPERIVEVARDARAVADEWRAPARLVA
jgi:hypothetical protein